MKHLKHLRLALLCALGLAAGQAVACYTVFDRGNNVVYNAQTPPVDMSLPLHQTLPDLFPGGHLVFDASTDCPVTQPPVIPLTRFSAETSPLLTDRSTARAMGLPHTLISDDVALVAQRPDDMTPGVVVTESAQDPAIAATRAMGGPPGRPLVGKGKVITELRNPRLTIVQDGDGKVVTEVR